MKPSFIEIIITLLIIGILVFFVNPFMAWMPSSFHYMAVGGLVVLVGVFVGLFWKEKPQDEREELHRYISARFAYFAGVIVLTLAVAVESFMNGPSVWLVGTLVAMILAKLLGHAYARSRS